MKKPTPKPINRSPLRLRLGKIYFSCLRWLFWIFGGLKFAKKKGAELEFEHYSHQTPLLRKLKDVDMELQYNKIRNLKIAVSKINGVIIYPGETFSYWKLIGKPTKKKGYLKGMILQSGRVTAGTGGGLCQLSNLIYWMTIHTPLTITERHRHGYYVFPDSNRTQPFGSGATCFYNYRDLMIKNNTNQVFQLFLEVTETHLRGMWKSNISPQYKYEVYEKEHLMQPEFWGGYTRHNILFRKVFNLDDVKIEDEFIAENHAIMMYSPLIETPIKPFICFGVSIPLSKGAE
jgi:vancomycin resistance protein VanW